MNSVEVRNAYAGYRSDVADQKSILNGLNMTVKSGSIYALIGASGCGKTTLLSCILGMKTLDSGSITVLGRRVTESNISQVSHLIGFMPQEIALIPELTIIETLSYFGNIFLMDQDTLDDRAEMIMELLELQNNERQIQHLSGGQQRRVSLAAAIIHNPLILILDEPTVGLDSLLREKIWKFLIKSTRESNLSIIITTHYISEAQQSDRCGMMRDGVLLTEDSPTNILLKYKATSLDEAFLNLCLLRREIPSESAENLTTAIDEMDESETRDKQKIHNFSVEKKNFRPQVIGALSRKELLRIKRQIAEVLFILVLPVLNILGFSYAIGGLPYGLRLGIVNYEVNNQSTCAAHSNQSVAHLNVNGECLFSHASCHLLRQLSDRDVTKVYYGNYDAAYTDAKGGKLHGVLSIPHNLSTMLTEAFANGDLQNLTSFMDINLDQSDLQLTTFLQIRLFQAYESFSYGLFANCNRSDKLLSVPIDFSEPFNGALDSDFKIAMLPAVFLQSILFPATNFAAFGIAQMRLDGVWDRTVLAGVQPLEILITQVILCVITQLISLTEVLVTSYLTLSIPIKGSLWLLVFFELLACFCGSFLGITVSVVGRNFRAITFIAFLLMLLMTVLCGVQWPVEGQPWLLQKFSKSLPVTLPSLSIRNIIVKGSGLEDPVVYTGLIVNVAWIVGLSLFLYVVTKRRRFYNK